MKDLLTCDAVLQLLGGMKWYITKLSIFPLFHGFNLQIFWSLKLTVIPWRTSNTISCSPQTCCLQVVNKKHFSGLNDEIFAKSWVYFPQRIKFWKTLANFLLLSAEKSKNFTFFFIDLLTNYVGVIVLSFKLYCFQQSLSGTKSYIKNLDIFPLFVILVCKIFGL